MDESSPRFDPLHSSTLHLDSTAPPSRYSRSHPKTAKTISADYADYADSIRRTENHHPHIPAHYLLCPLPSNLRSQILRKVSDTSQKSVILRYHPGKTKPIIGPHPSLSGLLQSRANRHCLPDTRGHPKTGRNISADYADYADYADSIRRVKTITPSINDISTFAFWPQAAGLHPVKSA